MLWVNTESGQIISFIFSYLISSILAVFAVFTDVVLQFLDFELYLIVLLSYFICLSAFNLKDFKQKTVTY